MIDRDGIERPDKFDEHMRPIKHDTRKIKFDENYSFRPRNIFFRIWAGFFKCIGICVLFPFFKLKYGAKIYGKENYKKIKKGGFIATLNHSHICDDLCAGTNVFPCRKVYFATLDRSIRRPVVGFFLRTLGGIPIPAHSISGMRKYNEDISYLLKKKKPVLYNPEGSMWPYYRELRPFKRGAFQLAVKNEVPILPIAVTFKRKKKRNGKFKYKTFYTLCEPVFADMTLPDDRARCEQMLKETHQKMEDAIAKFYSSQDCGFDDEFVFEQKNDEVLEPAKR